jgi:hypothetical protein
MFMLALALRSRNSTRWSRRTRIGSPCPSMRSDRVAVLYMISRPLSAGGPLRMSCMLTQEPSQWWAASRISWS